MSLFRKSRKIAVWDIQTLGGHRQVWRPKGRASSCRRKEEVGGVVLNKRALEENESLKW